MKTTMKRDYIFKALLNCTFATSAIFIFLLCGCNKGDGDGSQSNGDIAFASNRDGASRIYVADNNGQNVRQVTDDAVLLSNGEEYTLPSFSRDGTELAFVIYPTGSAEFSIGKVNTDGSDKRLLNSGVPDLQHVNQISTPTWTSYEDVYFIAGDPLGLYYHSGNTGVNRISAEFCYSLFGCNMYVSPDACLDDDSGIIFGSGGNILKVGFDGQVTTLFSNIGHNEYPSYSPNGKKIVTSNGIDIFVMDADGSDLFKLTNGAAGTELNRQPVWSPDGKKIAYTSYRNNSSQIYTMNSDGSNKTNITNDNSYNWGPTWGAK